MFAVYAFMMCAGQPLPPGDEGDCQVHCQARQGHPGQVRCKREGGEGGQTQEVGGMRMMVLCCQLDLVEAIGPSCAVLCGVVLMVLCCGDVVQ